MPSPTNDASPAADVEQQLRAELAAALEHLAHLEEEYATLLADPSAIQEDKDATRALLVRAQEAAAAAQRAVDRLESGTYGRCVRCGQPIPPERLEAIPDTDRCVTCQQLP